MISKSPTIVIAIWLATVSCSDTSDRSSPREKVCSGSICCELLPDGLRTTQGDREVGLAALPSEWADKLGPLTLPNCDQVLALEGALSSLSFDGHGSRYVVEQFRRYIRVAGTSRLYVLVLPRRNANEDVRTIETERPLAEMEAFIAAYDIGDARVGELDFGWSIRRANGEVELTDH